VPGRDWADSAGGNDGAGGRMAGVAVGCEKPAESGLSLFETVEERRKTPTQAGVPGTEFRQSSGDRQSSEFRVPGTVYATRPRKFQLDILSPELHPGRGYTEQQSVFLPLELPTCLSVYVRGDRRKAAKLRCRTPRIHQHLCFFSACLQIGRSKFARISGAGSSQRVCLLLFCLSFFTHSTGPEITGGF